MLVASNFEKGPCHSGLTFAFLIGFCGLGMMRHNQLTLSWHVKN